MPSELLTGSLGHIVFVFWHFVHSAETVDNLLWKLGFFILQIQHLVIIDAINSTALVLHLHEQHLIDVGLLCIHVH
jgi:hypothetical protein